MKKVALTLILISAAVIIMVLPACKKTKAQTEPFLTVETTPANKSNNLNILGPDFPLTVEVTSVMPASGVKIQVSANAEGATTPAFFTATNNSTAPENNYTITNTPSGVTCVVTITVSSLSTPTNVWTGTYRYSKK